MNTVQKYCFFVTWGESLGVPWHLARAGKEVIVGLIDDFPMVGMDEEKPEKKKRRMQLGQGMVKTMPATKLLEQMQGWDDKDEWFVFCDHNSQWRFGKQLEGFKSGYFPSKIDQKLEEDRNFAKDFVKKYYPDIKVAETEQFNSIDDAIEFINESEEFWALKANGEDEGAPTVVPSARIAEHAKEELADALRSGTYEKTGFILERQIRDGLEVCCNSLWYDGKLISTEIDLEHKLLGAGNTGYQVGCGGNLMAVIPEDCELVQKTIVGTGVVEKLAKKHRGMWYADMNVIIKDGEMYFLEFGFRPGYDSFVTSVEMAGGASSFFDAVIEGDNPHQVDYGVGIRAFNLKNEDGLPKADSRLRWNPEVTDHIYPITAKMESGAYTDTGYLPDVVVFTGSSDDAEYAAIKAYEVADQFSYDGLYYRPKSDWSSTQYKGNITDRLEQVQRFIASPSG